MPFTLNFMKIILLIDLFAYKNTKKEFKNVIIICIFFALSDEIRSIFLVFIEPLFFDSVSPRLLSWIKKVVTLPENV